MRGTTALAEPDETAAELPDDGARVSPPRWLRPLRRRVLRLPAGLLLWQITIAVIGAVIVALGVLLVPLPGPGWALIFGGFGVWATEFRWAQRLLLWARRMLTSWLDWVKDRPRAIQLLIAVAGIAFLAAILYLSWRLLL
jgi:uncharacterized protein (TIGR02611 family)